MRRETLRAEAETTRLDVSTLGTVSPQLCDEVVENVAGCYALLDVPLPPRVSLYIFDTVSRQQTEQERERRELGVVFSGSDPLPVGHSAWGDTPRLTVCAELLRPHPELLRGGMVHVAAAHTVLHGSADYYLFRIPAEIVGQARSRGIGSALLQQYLYLVATAVKGHAAVRLLVDHGCIASQVALAMHQLEVTTDDLVAWQLARSHPHALVLYLLAQLRPLLSAQPLLVHAPSLIRAIRGLTAHLPGEERERLVGLSGCIAATLTDDTRADIQSAFSQAWTRLVWRDGME
jgi:hypothetical protein